MLGEPRALHGRLKHEPMPVLIVSDPGPDPDDVKTLLVAATLHRRRRIRLLGVVCNGGGQPAARARLGRCVLDHAGVPDVPVGIGSHGVPYATQPHEYDIEGYADVGEGALRGGHELLVGALRSAPARSVRVVLISSLRDFADVCISDPALVRAKVHTVSIQGGLERDEADSAAGGPGWRQDSSVNLQFDTEAAETVYRFCFAEGIRMSVVSRHAVPLLEMGLAKAFAQRMPSPLINYLARAQYLGLVSLWAKVCASSGVPRRCSKEWFFSTFCGISRNEFVARGLSSLDASDSIIPFLHG
jgi:hypothetical protein